MQPIQYFNSNSSGCCGQKVLMPVVYQKFQTIAAGTGQTANEILSITEGDCAAYGGQLVNNGCYNLKAIISFLKGDDCDACTVDVLSTESIEIIIPKNSVFPLPDGYYQQIQLVTVDADGNNVSNTTDQTVSYYSSHIPPCEGCVQAIANVVTPCGVGDSGQQIITDDDTNVNDNTLSFDILGMGANGAGVYIWSLDNNFNLSVNGTDITTKKQINAGNPADLPKPYPDFTNLTFADGSRLLNGTPWDYPNDSPEPLVKITISNTGAVSIMGWKSAGNYLPMVLDGGATFNTVPVNTNCSQPNVYLFSQSTLNNPTSAAVQILGL